MGDQPDGRLDEGTGARVVDLEVDAPKRGQGMIDRLQPANVGETHAIVRLVVVAH
jgi:hypothetical protein